MSIKRLVILMICLIALISTLLGIMLLEKTRRTDFDKEYSGSDKQQIIETNDTYETPLLPIE